MDLERAEAAVEASIAAGRSFEEIEAFIETLPVSEEEQTVLWLIAWAEGTNPAMRRRVLAETAFLPRR